MFSDCLWRGMASVKQTFAGVKIDIGLTCIVIAAGEATDNDTACFTSVCARSPLQLDVWLVAS